MSSFVPEKNMRKFVDIIAFLFFVEVEKQLKVIDCLL